MNLFSSLNDALFLLALVFDLILILTSIYFKEEKLFFLAFLLLIFKLGFFYASLYQAKLFASLFLPFFFAIFVFIKEQKQIINPTNAIKFALLAFVFLLSLYLEQNTNFNASLDKKFFIPQGFEPTSQLGLIVFILALIFLLLKALSDFNFAYVVALILAYLPFFSRFFTASFACMFLFIYLLYRQYRFAFYDKQSKLANKKALQRFYKGSSYDFLALFKLDKKEKLNEKKEQALSEITISFLNRVLDNKLFLYKEGVYASLFKDGNEAKQKLELIRSFIEKHSFRLGSEDYKTTMSIAFVYIKIDLEYSLELARKSLVKAENEGGNKIISLQNQKKA